MKNLSRVMILAAFSLMGCAVDGADIEDPEADEGEEVDASESAATARLTDCLQIVSHNRKHRDNDITGSWYEHTITVKNVCSERKATIDVASQVDPRCNCLLYTSPSPRD